MSMIDRQTININEESEIQTADVAEEMSIPVETPEAPVVTSNEVQEQPKGRRASLMAAVRNRAYSADLTKAHVALMEREVLLPRTGVINHAPTMELFRLVHRHYRMLQAWH